MVSGVTYERKIMVSMESLHKYVLEMVFSKP